MKSVSTDIGKTWSIVENSEIPNPGSAADVIKLKSSRWLYVGNDTDNGRHRLSVWLSEDEGKSWPFRKTIVNDLPGSQVRAHYPAAIQGENDKIFISYTNQVADSAGTGSVKNIAVASFTEEWLMK
jgi:predicted neuraminidase